MHGSGYITSSSWSCSHEAVVLSRYAAIFRCFPNLQQLIKKKASKSLIMVLLRRMHYACSTRLRLTRGKDRGAALPLDVAAFSRPQPAHQR